MLNFQIPTWHDVLGHILLNLAHIAGATTIGGHALQMGIVIILALFVGTWAAKLGTDPDAPLLSEDERVNH